MALPTVQCCRIYVTEMNGRIEGDVSLAVRPATLTSADFKSSSAQYLVQSSFVSASLSRLQLAIYPLLTVGVPYLYQRLERRMTSLSFSNIPSRDPRRLLWTLTDQLHRAYEAAALVNFAAFLADGRYRTLTDRILGMRLTYSERTLNRNVSFEFLNRQLVWHAFTEFLLFLLPIIRPKRLLKRMMRLPTHPRILAFWLAVLPKWLASRAGLSRDPHSGKPRYRLPIRVPFLTSSADSKGKASEGGKYASLPAGICAICWERIETEVAATSSSVSMGNVGIPSSDPLDPSSGAFAPSSTAASTASSTIRNSQYHNASRAFGVSQDGIPYANALTHTAYAAEPCGCEYCYFCLAEKLLSEEAGEELEDSKSASSGPPVATSQSHGTSRKGKKSSKGAPPKDVIVSHGVGAWDCLRCGHKVRGMRRVVAGEDEDDEGAKAADERLLEGPTQPNRTRPTPPTDQPRNASKSSMPATQSKVQTKEQSHVFGDTDEEELDLDELTSSST